MANGERRKRKEERGKRKEERTINCFPLADLATFAVRLFSSFAASGLAAVTLFGG
jgi:hypothetical protein